MIYLVYGDNEFEKRLSDHFYHPVVVYEDPEKLVQKLTEYGIITI